MVPANVNQTPFQISDLLHDEAWPHPVEALQLLETHISWVILTGPFAYKIKKPVNFGFIDYETLERRREFCRLEVELNRRFAPDLYLGVVPVINRDHRLVVADEELNEAAAGQAAIEYAVKMRQFPQSAIAAAILQQGKLTNELVEAFGCNLARLHESIESALPCVESVQPGHVADDALDNFPVLEEFFAGDVRRRTIAALKSWTQGQIPRLMPQFRERLEEARVRRCHGDMHLRNIVLLGDKLLPFDGIEFNEQLQWIDLLSELAFPVMDLAARGSSGLAWRLLNAYLEASGDYHNPELLRFYLVYRALVRAKVTCLNPANASDEERRRYTTGDPALDQRAGSWDKYLQIADRMAHPGHPCLAITHGFSGSGKSTAALRFIDAAGGIRVRSDVERQRLAARFRTRDRYSPAMTEQVYIHLRNIAERNLRAGFSVVVDATFLRQCQRRRFQELATELSVEFAILDCDAPPEELRRRILARDHDPSEATVKVLEGQMLTHEPLTTQELQFVRPIPVTNLPPDQTG
jgi:aminoglycoside phosphotransferase family enzyme/predicted kinase